MFLYVSGSAICKLWAWQFRYLFVSLEVLEFPRTLIVGLCVSSIIEPPPHPLRALLFKKGPWRRTMRGWLGLKQVKLPRAGADKELLVLAACSQKACERAGRCAGGAVGPCTEWQLLLL